MDYLNFVSKIKVKMNADDTIKADYYRANELQKLIGDYYLYDRSHITQETIRVFLNGWGHANSENGSIRPDLIDFVTTFITNHNKKGKAQQLKRDKQDKKQDDEKKKADAGIKVPYKRAVPQYTKKAVVERVPFANPEIEAFMQRRFAEQKEINDKLDGRVTKLEGRVDAVEDRLAAQDKINADNNLNFKILQTSLKNLVGANDRNATKTEGIINTQVAFEKRLISQDVTIVSNAAKQIDLIETHNGEIFRIISENNKNLLEVVGNNKLQLLGLQNDHQTGMALQFEEFRAGMKNSNNNDDTANGSNNNQSFMSQKSASSLLKDMESQTDSHMRSSLKKNVVIVLTDSQEAKLVTTLPVFEDSDGEEIKVNEQGIEQPAAAPVIISGKSTPGKCSMMQTSDAFFAQLKSTPQPAATINVTFDNLLNDMIDDVNANDQSLIMIPFHGEGDRTHFPVTEKLPKGINHNGQFMDALRVNSQDSQDLEKNNVPDLLLGKRIHRSKSTGLEYISQRNEQLLSGKKRDIKRNAKRATKSTLDGLNDYIESLDEKKTDTKQQSVNQIQLQQEQVKELIKDGVSEEIINNVIEREAERREITQKSLHRIAADASNAGEEDAIALFNYIWQNHFKGNNHGVKRDLLITNVCSSFKACDKFRSLAALFTSLDNILEASDWIEMIKVNGIVFLKKKNCQAYATVRDSIVLFFAKKV